MTERLCGASPCSVAGGCARPPAVRQMDGSLEAAPDRLHLPQYHRFGERPPGGAAASPDWTMVARARRGVSGHYQPRLPADLGFYDLRLGETRQAQADLARQFGIDGFCYYHYWFNGKQLLERPFNEVLASGRPGFPFLPVLGQRRLGANLGRAGRPRSDRADLFGRGRSPTSPLAGDGLPDPALHPGGGQAALPLCV